MFKSIEYKLYFFLFLLIAAVAETTYLLLNAEYVYVGLSVLVGLFSLQRLRKSYNQYNKNILFLLNALDNGDYSFNFAVNKLSRREKELNQMMNRIKDILSKARKEVIENEKFLSLIMESVSTGIIILNEDNIVVQTNRPVNQMLGLPVFTHLNQLSNIDKSFPDLFRNLAISDTKIIKVTNERDIEQISLRASEIVIKRGKLKIITLSNIGSELDYNEMDSWIRLIRVMTHEIMNSIAPITSLTDTLLFAYNQNKHDDSDELVRDTIEAMQTINTTAKGLINFVNSYRKFTGIPNPQLKSIDVKTLVEQAVALQSGIFEEKGISFELLLNASNPQFKVDESQIMQVLTNLLKNAVEASNENGGNIKIAYSSDLEKSYLDVSNNGNPIPEDILPNIFIPFFTTKEYGSGIGLSVSRYIMRLHGGNLTHFVKDGRTVFRMTFPNLQANTNQA